MSASLSSVWLGYLVVFAGGGVGASLRHFVNRLMMAWGLSGFPLATLVINVSGSLIMGLITGWFTFRGETASPLLRLGLTTGILGGYTTFSTFSLDIILLWQRGDNLGALVYGLGNLVPALIGVVAGLAAMRALLA